MGRTVLEWGLKALAGGVLVVVFAVLAEMFSPKRLAGILAAAPSVALGSLTVTIVMKGSKDAATSASTMALGALAFVVYGVVAAALIRRRGAWGGAGTALVAWGAMAAVLGLVAASA